MFKRSSFILIAGVVFAATAFAQQANIKLSVGQTSPNDGKQMFNSYCAQCHGADGKGVGPVASALIQKPVDLTVLARNNGGKFPGVHVLAVIQFGSSSAAAHGVKDMPVWGPILGDVDAPQAKNDDATKVLREKNLESYVESLQVK